MRVGGVFQVGEVNDMLDAIETNFGLQIERLGDKRRAHRRRRKLATPHRGIVCSDPD